MKGWSIIYKYISNFDFSWEKTNSSEAKLACIIPAWGMRQVDYCTLLIVFGFYFSFYDENKVILHGTYHIAKLIAQITLKARQSRVYIVHVCIQRI